MRLKKHLKRLLGSAGVYERAKASWVYDCYWKIVDRSILADRQKEIEFYRTLLVGFRKGDLILDIGANEGYKTGIFLQLGARVLAAEPDETNQEILKQRFEKYRLKKKPLVVVGKAVSNAPAIRTMWVDAPGSAKNTLSPKWAGTLREDERRFGQRFDFAQSKTVETVTVEDLVAAHGTPFFIKIDVEGHELSVLRGMKQPVPYLSFEVNLPEFKAEGLECVRLLKTLAPDGLFNYTADCRRGLALTDWVGTGGICAMLDSCADESIEIFWKTSVRPVPLEKSVRSETSQSRRIEIASSQ